MANGPPLPDELVTPGLLELLGADPVLGAGLVSDHGIRGNHRVVLLGHDFWQRRFGGDRDAVGSTITLDGAPHVVIGVLPADFHHPDPHRPLDPVDVFAPLVLDGAGGMQDVPSLRVLARLGPDASPSRLESRLELRTREMAIRTALGADAREVVRQVLGDALAMLLPGVALGIVIDLVTTRVLLSMIFGIGPLDPPSFVLAPLLIIVAGLVACLLAARRAARVDPMEALRHV